MTPLNMTDQFALDGDRVPERMPIDLGDREHDPFETVDPARRHVLVIEPSGWCYLAPHTNEAAARFLSYDTDHELSLCERVTIAFRAWRHEVHDGSRRPEDHPDEGRWWCDVSPDGVFEVGARIPDEVTG